MHTRCRASSMFSSSGSTAPACGRRRAMSYRPGTNCVPLVRCVRTLQVDQLADLDLALGAVLAGVDPGKRRERHAPGPFDGLVHRRHLQDPVTRDQVLRLGERPAADGAAPPENLTRLASALG